VEFTVTITLKVDSGKHNYDTKPHDVKAAVTRWLPQFPEIDTLDTVELESIAVQPKE
jgi:hypothetical protein